MAPEFEAGRRLLIVGGGYIGLEAASVGVKLGLDVTLIEMAPRILQRVASPETSDYFRRVHDQHGVKIVENMLDAGKAYEVKPWFWSDQYDVKLQIAGLNTGYDRIVTRMGEGAAASVWYYQSDRLLALDAMNDPRAFRVGKRLIEAGESPDPATILDTEADLRTLLNP